jgi:hypothetical protein
MAATSTTDPTYSGTRQSVEEYRILSLRYQPRFDSIISSQTLTGARYEDDLPSAIGHKLSIGWFSR